MFWALSMSMRTSSSTSAATFSEGWNWPPPPRPTNGSPCSSPNFTAPTRGLMPYSTTMALAIFVAISISALAPVVGLPKTSSSAARPPIAKTRRAKSSERLYMPLSSSEAVIACPPVRPRARMVTL